MPHPILKRPQALRDIEEIFVYLGTRDLEVGFRFLDTIEESLVRISLHPHSAPAKDLGLREDTIFRMYPVKGFRNYLVFFRVGGESVEIVRVLHGARDISRYLS